MASSTHQMDRLSALPDEVLITVLSLLPTRIAARTSPLSRHFRHLWKASPSVDLPFKYLPSFNHSTYVAMANSALLSRTSSYPLLRLHLNIGYRLPGCLTDSFISSLLVHAHALGLRHLTIDVRSGFLNFEPVLRSVFSINSLESLSIFVLHPMTIPSAITLTRLKSLSINLITDNPTHVERLLSELCCLEDLQLSVYYGVVCLSSPSIKKLDVLLNNPDSLRLSMPSLEFLRLKNCLKNIPLIHGEIPFIRKAVVTLYCSPRKDVTAVAKFLNFISHVEELSLDLKEEMESDYPFPVLLEPGKEVPTFPNLKHLDMSICFHECNFKAVVSMLHHCPALESLKLHHKTDLLGWVPEGTRNAWKSKLPRTRDGNYQHVCFKNLHLGENREEFKKLLNKKCTSKRQRVRNAWKSKLPRTRYSNCQHACFKNLHLGENREEFKKLLNKKCTPKRQRVR